MKRTVKAWTTIHEKSGNPTWGIGTTKKDHAWLVPGEIVVPCTITYDDGKKPKKKARAK